MSIAKPFQLNFRTFFTVLSLFFLLLNPNTPWAAPTDSEVASEKENSQKEPVIPEFLLTTDTIPGPGDFLDSILHSLNKQSDESESTFKQLWAGMPLVLPDLHKVYLTL